MIDYRSGYQPTPFANSLRRTWMSGAPTLATVLSHGPSGPEWTVGGTVFEMWLALARIHRCDGAMALEQGVSGMGTRQSGLDSK